MSEKSKAQLLKEKLCIKRKNGLLECDEQTIKNAFYAATNIPSSLSNIDYQKANDIEKILDEINANLENMIAIFMYSGEIYAGEV